MSLQLQSLQFTGCVCEFDSSSTGDEQKKKSKRKRKANETCFSSIHTNSSHLFSSLQVLYQALTSILFIQREVQKKRNVRNNDSMSNKEEDFIVLDYHTIISPFTSPLSILIHAMSYWPAQIICSTRRPVGFLLDVQKLQSTRRPVDLFFCYFRGRGSSCTGRPVGCF